MTHQFGYRIARSSDLPNLLQTNVGMLGEVMDADLLPKLIKAGQVYCALAEDEVVALLYWQLDFLSRLDIWFLSQITTKPAWRRQGAALGLLRAFQNYARTRGVRKIYCDIHPDNQPSLALVRKLGAIESGAIKGFDDEVPEDSRIFFRFDL
jgi:ribosomal protein S18 acetylase RimI-like enzyme